MPSTADIAMKLFEACDGQRLGSLQGLLCTERLLRLQAAPLAEVTTLQGCADWMQGLMKMMPDGPVRPEVVRRRQ